MEYDDFDDQFYDGYELPFTESWIPERVDDLLGHIVVRDVPFTDKTKIWRCIGFCLSSDDSTEDYHYILYDGISGGILMCCAAFICVKLKDVSTKEEYETIYKYLIENSADYSISKGRAAYRSGVVKEIIQQHNSFELYKNKTFWDIKK